jgi:hypothetical protein
MMRKYKARFFSFLVLVAYALGGLLLSPIRSARADSSIIGPYTEIQLPLEDLPALNENLAFHPVIDQYESGATLQIMYVLEDPREVPLARYAYYSEDLGVIAPNDLPSQSDIPENHERMEEILFYNPKTTNVYVRVMAPADQSVPDPLLEDPYVGFNISNRPALLVYFPGSGRPFPCAVPEYINDLEPYQLPSNIDGGAAVGSDGLYDPKAFAPPKPWYDNQNAMLAPGETREGWISCMVPDMPVENILIEAAYSYTPEPQSTPTPGPSPTPYDDSDCVIVDSFNDPVCSTGVCCKLSAYATLEAMIDATSTAWASEDDGEINWEAYESSLEIGWAPAWSYTRTSTIPDEGIRLEDTSMIFINEAGDQKTAFGKVLIKTANIVQIEQQNFDDVVFVAEVGVEPDGLSEEDLQGYALYRIYADVEVYERANSTTAIFGIKEVQNTLDSPYERFLGANFNYISLGGALQLERGKQPFANMFMHKPDSPFTGYVFGNLEAYFDEPPALYEKVWNGPIPTTLWFNIDNSAPPSGTIDSPKVRALTRYAAKGVNIYNTSLVSSTTVCDAVECLDVQDPEDDDHEVRTVPLMCPGEWANNFKVDGVSLENLDFIGTPGEGSWIRTLMQTFPNPPVTWIINGTILGGLSPWQSEKDPRTNLELVNLESGLVLDTDSEMLPLYFNTSDSYYVPLSRYTSKLGWINHDVSNKTLMFSVVQKSESAKTDNAILLLREGPAWKTGCTRPLMETTSSRDVYSPPLNGSSFEIFAPYHQMRFMMPGFAYPVSEPLVRTGFYLGEEGTFINGKTLIPAEVKIIPGKERDPIYYVPQEDAYYPWKEHESINNLIFFRNVDAILIPQSSSLVLVNIKRGNISRLADCSRTDEEGVHLSYPGYYPVGADKRQLSGPTVYTGFSIYYTWVCSTVGKDEVWLVFRFPSLDFDQSKLVLSIKGEDNWNLWNLTETP